MSEMEKPKKTVIAEEVERKPAGRAELLSPEIEKTIEKVASDLFSELGNGDVGAHREGERKRHLTDGIRGIARSIMEKTGKEPTYVQIWERAKSISG